MEWSPYQLEIFEWIKNSRDSLIIEAVAGSGKTTTIVEAISHVPLEQSVAFLAFNKSIAEELKRRVTQPNARCMTLHSVGLVAWKEYLDGWDSQSLAVDGKKIRNIVDEMELPYGEWTRDMSKLVGIAKGSGIVPRGAQHADGALVEDSEDVWEDLMDFYGIDPDEVDLDLVREVLTRSIAQAKQTVDFDDMLYMPVIAGAKFQQTDVVFLDEAQDVNGIQTEIVARMLGPESRVVAVGDPHQAIYGFRGALADSMQQIGKRFHCTALPLSVSYRCPKLVVDKARQWVRHIESHEAAIDGFVGYGDWQLKDFHAGDAILCRNARPVVSIAFLLIRNKIAAKVAGRDIGQGLVALVNKMKARGIEDLETRLVAYRSREAARAKGNEAKIAALDDKLETLRVFMDEAGPHAGIGTLIKNIEALFGDSDMRGVVICSTVHKSKGLEFDRVFVLDADEFMPSPWARQDWEHQQEENLMYVAATRSKRELRYVTTYDLQASLQRTEVEKEPS